MEITKSLFRQTAMAACVAAFVFPFAIAADNADKKLSPSAKEFIARGAQTVLAQCDLPKRQCNGKPLKVKSADIGESDGEKKSFETLIAGGLETMVIFSASMRSKYVLSSVAVSSAAWPEANGVKIGMERDVVVLALGEPNGGTKNSCDSYADDETGAEALVCYGAGKVGRIRWESPAD